MVERSTCLVLRELYLGGCRFNQQLNEDGGGCLSGATQAMGVVTIFTLGLATPFMVAGANSSVDLDDHAACMKTKGYTIHDQGPQKQP